MSVTEKDFSLKDFFVPFTTSKGVHILIVVGLIVYFNILFNGFVWDDLTYIIGNSEMKSLNIITLFGPNTFNSSGYFRPIPAVFFSTLFHLFGNTAFYYHLIQMVLHIGCTIILLFIFKNFLKPITSFLLSLLFLVHPINVESVAYVGAAQSQLYFLFGGIALLLSLKDKLSFRKTIIIHLFILLTIFTKEVGIIYVFLIYIYRFLFKKIQSKRFYLSTATSLAFYLLVRILVLGTLLHRMSLIPISQIPLIGRISHIPVIIFYYLETFFFPHSFAIDQIWTIKQLTVSNFYLPLMLDILFLSLITLFVYFVIKNYKKYTSSVIFFLLWFISGMAFLLQIFPLDMTVADRWFYIPIVGLLGLLGILYETFITKHFSKYSKKLLITYISLIGVLSIITINRNSEWKNPLTLYLHDVQEYENYDLENYLGAELVGVNRSAEALVHFKKSVELLPHDTNLYNVGSVYESLRDFPNARIYYLKTLNEKNENYGHSEVRKLAYLGLIKTMLLSDTPETVDSYIQNAVKEYSDNGTLWAYLAINEYKLNRYDSALIAASKAAELLPNSTTKKLLLRVKDKQPIDLKLE